MSRTQLSMVYTNMKQRCYNPKHPKYLAYGNRGITVCDEWKDSSTAFYEWALRSGYEKGLSLDRKDNDKGYSPANCRWVSRREQQNNMRTNHVITFDGRTQTTSQWAEEIGIHVTSLFHRISSGWSEEESVSIPRGGKRKLGLLQDAVERPRDAKGRFCRSIKW